MSNSNKTNVPIFRQENTMERRPQKPSKLQQLLMDKRFVAVVLGCTALVLYLIMSIISGVFLGKANHSLSSEKQVNEIVAECNHAKTPPPNRAAIHVKLQHTIGETVRVIFYTWLIIIYTISFMVYIIYVIAAWMRNYTLGRAYFVVIAIITFLNFVPCSYIFSFGDITTEETVTFWAMLGVLLFFRILDVLAMYFFLFELKKAKTLAEIKTASTIPSAIVVVQSEPEVPLQAMNVVKVSPAPDAPGNPFEEAPPKQ